MQASSVRRNRVAFGSWVSCGVIGVQVAEGGRRRIRTEVRRGVNGRRRRRDSLIHAT